MIPAPDRTYRIKSEVSDHFSSYGLTHFALLGKSSTCVATSEHWRAHHDAFEKWLREGFHGDMSYLEAHRGLRSEPERLLGGMKSSFVFLVPYATGHRVRRTKSGLSSGDPSLKSASSESDFSAKFARYARSRDYHRVIRKRLTNCFVELREKAQFPASEFRVLVDSAPFLDRAHAQAGGLGFIGKNTMLIRPGLGSFFFIASVLTTLPPESWSEGKHVTPTALLNLNCGSCSKCVDACPTQALSGRYTLDARRCLAFWSIESRGPVPSEYHKHFSDRFFGCDICQEVCPYNEVTLDLRHWEELRESDPRLGRLTFLDMACMDRAQYEQWFGGLPVTRAKYAGIVRNAIYAIKSLGDCEQLRKVVDHWRSRDDTPALIEDVLRQISD